MKQIYKYLLWLIILNLVLDGTAILLRSLAGLNLVVKDIIILSSLFSGISVLSLIIFLRGQSTEPDSQTMHTLVSISLKFLLDMILALVWFFIFKNSSLTTVFVFFVIYLTLTLFTIFIILKILKNRSL
jgi:hypothetical protein